jgi:hypothetical protein
MYTNTDLNTISVQLDQWGKEATYLLKDIKRLQIDTSGRLTDIHNTLRIIAVLFGIGLIMYSRANYSQIW